MDTMKTSEIRSCIRLLEFQNTWKLFKHDEKRLKENTDKICEFELILHARFKKR